MKISVLTLSILVAVSLLSCKSRQASQPENEQPAVTAAVNTQKMITAKVFIKPGFEDQFIEAAKWIIENTLKEEGCLEYIMYQDPYIKTNFFFFERYRDRAAIDAHFSAPYFKEFGDKVGPITSQATEIKIWDIAEDNNIN